jgi:hypothetical protein
VEESLKVFRKIVQGQVGHPTETCTLSTPSAVVNLVNELVERRGVVLGEVNEKVTTYPVEGRIWA